MLAFTLTLPLAAAIAIVALLNLTDFASGGDDVVWGAFAWLVSAAIFGVGVAAPRGPARRARRTAGVALAAVWLVLGLALFVLPALARR